MPPTTPRPPYAARIRSARERLGISPQALSDQLGWGASGLWDLEAYDDELPMTISVHDIGRLCDTLHLDPAALLAPSSAEVITAEPRLTPPEVVALIQRHLQTAGHTPESYGEHVGWDVASLLAAPTDLWALNADGLHDVCSGAGINWLRALPPAPATAV